jgi:hypothetical protein
LIGKMALSEFSDRRCFPLVFHQSLDSKSIDLRMALVHEVDCIPNYHRIFRWLPWHTKPHHFGRCINFNAFGESAPCRFLCI